MKKKEKIRMEKRKRWVMGGKETKGRKEKKNKEARKRGRKERIEEERN